MFSENITFTKKYTLLFKIIRVGGRIIMKEPYETPVMEIIEIDAEDIITTSGAE